MSTESSSRRGFLANFRRRRIERNRAEVLEEYRRYESIKLQYDWKGKKYPFAMHDDSCEIQGKTLEYSWNATPSFVSDYVDECERKAIRHHAKQEKQAKRRARYASLYGNLENRILNVLGGKFKYCRKGVKVRLTLPDEVEYDETVLYEYNEYDKAFLEEKVIRCEQAHQKRLEFIRSQSSKTEE